MTPIPLDPATRDVVAKTLWGECRGESYEGQVGVCWVIRNRAELPGWWGHDAMEVCLKPGQFSCWLAADVNRPKMRTLSPDDPVYRVLSTIVDAVFGGFVLDPTRGSTHYEVIGTGAAWAKGREPEISIGHHQFYRIGLGA